MSTFYQIKDPYEVPIGSPQIVVLGYADKYERNSPTRRYNIVWFIRNVLTDGIVIYTLYRREDKTDHWSLCRYNYARMKNEPLIENVSLFHLACFAAKHYRELMRRPCFALDDMTYDAPK